jgi:Fe(3+) dicitrate transport protein
MNVFAGVHKGFSPPGVPSVTSTIGQAKSEEAMNYELGYRLFNKSLHAQVVGFLNQYSNILGSDNISAGGLGTGNMFNAGKAQVRGVEVSVEYNLLSPFSHHARQKIPLTISYTYTDAKFLETFKNAGGDWGTGTINKGDLIPFITPHIFSAGLGYQTKKVSVYTNLRYVGLTRIKPGQNEILLPNDRVKYTDVNAIGSFMILDVSANYHLSKMFTLYSTIGNLTNNKTMVTNLPQGYRSNMPLNFNLGVKANF